MFGIGTAEIVILAIVVLVVLITASFMGRGKK
jgi:hypothetical protein